MAWARKPEERFTKDFCDRHQPGSSAAAHLIVPLVLDLLRPRSVLDVGCGTGVWLLRFIREGIADVVGIDGPHVREESLRISSDHFVSHDLTTRFDLGRQFDLVISLEVAEHLPATVADSFVDCLTRHGSIVLFSAAIPGQGGRGHIKEPWPAYWIDRFNRRGYVVVDCLRSRIWDLERVPFWYRQNLFFFVAEDRLSQIPRLSRELGHPSLLPVAVVHPGSWLGWLVREKAERDRMERVRHDRLGTRRLGPVRFGRRYGAFAGDSLG